jgi:type IX secretion system PorP/SprF family membrane protein
MTLNFIYRNVNHSLLVFLLLLISSQVIAQKDAQFSLFNLNSIYLNPAAAGADGLTRIQVSHRTQYVGYQSTYGDNGGALSTQLASFSMPIKNFGIGFYALNDNSGPRNDQDFKLMASYHFPVAGGNLFLGASAGMFRQAINFDQLKPRDPGDDLIKSGTIAEMNPDVGAGLRFASDAFHVGLSVAHLLKPKYSFGSETGVNPLPTTAYLNAGMNIEVGYLLDVQPIVLVKAYSASVSAEGGATVTFNKKFWAGATYRQQDTYFIVMGGIYLLPDQSLRLSGAYDMVIGGNKQKSPSSFEVMLSYAIQASKGGKKTIIRTPRFRY